MAYIGRGTDKISNVEVLDNITFDGSSSYTLQKSSVNFTPSSANTLLLSIDGVVQAGNFTISGSTIDFGTAVAGTSTCDFVLHYGVGLITAPSDGTVTTAKLADDAVTSSKLASGAVPNQSAFKNIIINGDMSIAQRGTSTSSITSNGYYTVDRFQTGASSLGTWTQSQSTEVPSGQGFGKSLKMDCTTADASPSASDKLFIRQKIEGQNLQYLKKGTSSAESTTLSFWVKSNKTGTYIAELNDTDNTRTISKSYTISSADTWEKKTITFAGDTSGTLNNDNANSLECTWYLGVGSNFTSGTLQTDWGSQVVANRAVGQVNLADNTSNEWYITGIQLEAGTTASDFEFLPHDVNLQRCERYCSTLASGLQSLGIGSMNATDSMYFPQKLKQTMRATPSLNQVTGTDYYAFIKGSGTDNFNSITLIGAYSNERYIELANVSDISGTAGHSGFVRANNSSVLVLLEAEL